VSSRAIALVLALVLAPAAGAATLCRLSTAGGIAFGGYDVLAATPLDTLLSFDVACDRSGGPPSVTLVVRLGQGANGTSVNNRRMLHVGASGDFLSYGLYSDVSRTSVWGFSDGVNTVSRRIAVPNNSSASTTFTIYGRIPAGQNVTVGPYRDSVQITVTP
jgi:spore coat protein U-like protein